MRRHATTQLLSKGNIIIKNGYLPICRILRIPSYYISMFYFQLTALGMRAARKRLEEIEKEFAASLTADQPHHALTHAAGR